MLARVSVLVRHVGPVCGVHGPVQSYLGSHAAGFTSEQRRAITALARRVIGMEIASETDNDITMRNMLDGDKVSVGQMLRRLRSVTLSTQEAMTALLAGEADGVDRSTDRDDEADRTSGSSPGSF